MVAPKFAGKFRMPTAMGRVCCIKVITGELCAISYGGLAEEDCIRTSAFIVGSVATTSMPLQSSGECEP